MFETFPLEPYAVRFNAFIRCGPRFSSFSCIGFYCAAQVVISLPVCHAQPERRTKQRPNYGGKDVAANEA